MNVLLPLLLCRIRFRTRFHTRYRTRFRGRFRYEKIMKTICFLYDLTVFQPIPKSHIFTLHFCSPYVANLKNPRFLRHTQGISHQSQFAVNPCVGLADGMTNRCFRCFCLIPAGLTHFLMITAA